MDQYMLQLNTGRVNVFQTRLKDGWTPNRIAGELGCAPNTVRNEIKRGTVTLYRGNIFRYKAKVGQAAYEKNREACCRHYDLLEKSAFISYVEEHFFEDEWSLDVCAHRALKDGTFTREQIVCTKTLYGYADLGIDIVAQTSYHISVVAQPSYHVSGGVHNALYNVIII